MFVLYLLLACFVIVVFENIFLFVGIFFSVLILILILWFLKKNNLKKNLIYVFLSFLLVLFSFFIRYNNYFQNDYSQDFVWSGTIVDSLWEQKYLFQNSMWDKFLYYSSKNYEIGEVVFNIAYFTGIIQKDLFLSEINIWIFYQKYLYMKWYRWILYEKNSQTIWFDKLNFIQKIKKYYKDRVVWVYGENKISWLILWMSIWDKSLIHKDFYQDFIDSSLVHIVAVSWWNLVILIVFMNIVLFFLPYYIRLFVILLVIVFYALLCGMDTSVFRAVIMSWLIMIALFFGRKISLLRSMFYAIFFMLLFNPYYLVYDLGFLLSFGAIIWIEIFQRYRRFGYKILNQSIMSIIWAQIWVLPILILYIGKISFLWFLANIILLPFVWLLMIYGPLSVLWFCLSWSQIFLQIWKFLMDQVYNLANFFSIYNVYLKFNSFLLRFIIFIFMIILLLYLFLQKRKIIEINKKI